MESEKVSAEDQQDYWPGVGMLKQSCLDLANATRELSKTNDGANPAAFKELLHVIKYVLDTKNLGLKIEHMGNFNEPWQTVFFSDSNYAGDLVSRRSISDFILCVRHTSLLVIKVTEKCVTFQLRGRVFSLVRGY